jgi:hypothetical protein
MLAATAASKARTCFLVPFDQDPKFVCRGDIIAEIDYKLKTGRRTALAGIGGVG